jgi:NitT/TauT family transport system substrate-binding protein
VNRRDFVKLSLMLGAYPAIQGCSLNPAPIRMVAQSWPGYEMLFAAQQMGLLDPSQCEIVETHSASVSMRLLASGAAECACLTMDEVLTCHEQGLALSVVAVLDFSAGADVVMTSAELSQSADFRGKLFGVESTATGAVMLQAFLKREQLSPSDINIVYLTVDQHEAALKNQQVDVLVTYEPVKIRLENLGFVTIYDSSFNAHQIFDVLAVSKAALDGHRAQLIHLLSAHFTVLERFNKHDPLILEQLSQRMGIPLPELENVYANLSMPDAAENYDLLSGEQPKINQKISDLEQVMLSSDLLTREFPAETITDASIISEIVDGKTS